MQDADYTYRTLKQENERLRRAVDELSILNDLALDIGGSLDTEKIMRSIISKSIRAVGAEQGDITLVADNESDSAKTLVRSMVSSKDHSPLHLNQNLLGWMQINKRPLLVNSPRTDERFQNVKWHESIRSVLCAPLMAKSKLIGILTIYNKKNEESFSDTDKRLLAIIAAQSAQVVENVRLHEEEEKYKAVREQMELASSIQKKLLPSDPPKIDDYSIGGKNVTAKSVGGDYYDYFKIDSHHWAVCLGDISGKGIPASLLMSNLQAILRGQALHSSSPGEILSYANIQLFRNTNPEKFATVFLGILNTESHTLTFSNGGHEYPFYLRPDGTYERLESNGLPLGIVEESEYGEKSVEMKPGDGLVIYSDGITDSINIEEEEFGEERLKELLLSAGSELYDPMKLIDTIITASIEHSGERPRFDDITALVLSRNP
ncbi:MAG: SpoIIE family protein phosphatase [Bacteroidetes bacterium]|jgi:serine phosphatase RsbU (regulator of sigma subunit)|nr:SpoIIE family protein phosphatase [Bacteroidota bacterium]